MNGTVTIEAAACLIEMAAVEEQRLAAALDTTEREDPGTPERWGAAAMFAHLTDWKAVQVERMHAHLAGVRAPACDGLPFPHRDPVAYEPLAAVPWDGVAARAALVSRELAAVTRRYADVDLVQRFDWTLGKPLAQQLLGRGVWHTLTHLTEYHREHARPEESARLAEVFGAAVVRLSAWPVAGDPMGHYNAACLCAASGHVDEARALLAEALRLAPELSATARVDPDLRAVA